MSIECGECEADLRGGHDPSCARYVKHAPTCPLPNDEEAGCDCGAFAETTLLFGARCPECTQSVMMNPDRRFVGHYSKNGLPCPGAGRYADADLAADIRDALEPFIGKPNNHETRTAVELAVERVLVRHMRAPKL